MDRFYSPQSAVIFGASANPSKGGHHVLLNLKHYMNAHNNPNLFIIHPKADNVKGVQCYRSLDALNYQKGRIDLAILVVPVPSVMTVVKECIAHNIRGILIESGNLSNDPMQAKKNAKELRALIKGKDIRIVGPNSIGFNVPYLEYCTPIKSFNKFLATGDRNVAICGQSGLFVTGFVEELMNRQYFDVSAIASIGNKIDVNECDILEHYLKDPKTHVIGMYLEDIKDGARFLELIRNNREKPIVLLKSGKSEKGKQAVQSHTGSLAGNYVMIETLAKQFGMTLVENYQEFFDALALLYRYPKLPAKRIGVISISGSTCVLSADYAEKYELEVPELSKELAIKLRPRFPDWAPIHNPVDTWASIEIMGPKPSFNAILRDYLESGEYDAIIMLTIASAMALFDWAFIQKIHSKYPHIPILFHFLGGAHIAKFTEQATEHGLLVFSNLENIFKHMARLVHITKKQQIER